MGIRMLNDFILVKPVLEDKNSSIALPKAFCDYDKVSLISGTVPGAKKGSVLYAREYQKAVEIDGETYNFVKVSDVMGIEE